MFLKNLFLLCLFFTSFQARALTVDGWDVRVEKVTVVPHFSLEQEMETYTGDMVLHKIEQTPADGYVYVVVDVQASRVESTAGLFDSSVIRLKTANEIVNRLPDDAFLVDYNIIPFTRLKVKLGTHKGSLVFEIPKSRADNLVVLYNNQPVE